MKIHPLHSRASGFTLMEMMLVLLIIALILAAVAGRFAGFTATAEEVSTKAKVNAMESALMSYRTTNMT